ncbi:MAG: hypothetical protein H7A46_26120 [Verrucomicrobiales bacterium]|nr:hypothetical protein [Verrucomicrobiales bacterium]
MSVQTVNGHVLLPHLPDWASPVAWQRAWQCQVGRSVGGSEGRLSVRERPRVTLRWELIPVNVTEQSLMHARLRAARKSGYACAPYWGRGLKIIAVAGAVLTLASTAWPFLQGDDWLLIRRLDVAAPEAWELCQVVTAAEADITLTVGPTYDWSVDAFVWPLLFGRFNCGDLSHRTDWHARVQCELRQLVTRPYAPLPPGPDPSLCAVDGVDAGDSFECYPVGYAGPFEGGNGWDGAWSFLPEPEVFGDSFEDYLTGQSDNFNAGTGFDGAWSFLPELGVWGDSFESYAMGSTPAGGGTGFTGDWTFNEGS